MALRKFTLVGLDEGGVRESNGNLRLVCLIDKGGKLAIWGTPTEHRNIDAVQAAKMPCDVECDCIPAGQINGHYFWIPERHSLKILSNPSSTLKST